MRRFSILVAGLAIAAAMSACSNSADDSVIPGNATAPAGFHPPTALNRTDFYNVIERRFNRLDINHDQEISKAELPKRHHDLVASLDANGDGKITKIEFIQGSLARFDKADINHDGVLTGEERHAAWISREDGDEDNDASPAATDQDTVSNATS